MKKEKSEIKISLKTAIALIIIFLVIIVVIIAVILGKNGNNNKATDNLASNNTTVTDIEEKESNVGDEFSTKFLKLENNKQNMVYSPLSIKYALKMLEEGANGNTKTQIENVLKNEELTKYNNIDNILSLANSVYIRDDYSKFVKEEFKNTLIEKYNAEINHDSFANANNINKWIEDKTFGIIKNMLNDETVQNPNSKMILINALAIDMEWEEQFDGTETHGDDFYLEDGSTMQASMMNKETESDNVSYYKDEEVTLLTMDLKEYEDTQLEFVAIMPNENNLSDYVETFSINECNNMLSKTTLASETKDGVEIYMPRFSFEYDLELRQDLINLGITDAFDEGTADFSNMAELQAGENLYVGDALHKANIDFTEKGIKAAAVTLFIMKTNAIIMEEPKEPETIRIDKPFLYLIKDKNTGEIWFVGTVYEPNSWEEETSNENAQ